MRKILSMLPLLFACSQAPADRSEMTADEAGPGINVTAAPGVAFNYRYAFRLPPARIAAAQESHAQACEKLGVSRCRITGMRYSLVGENRVDAMLAFKLDPAIARAFGRQGIATIEAADGMLVDSEITGVDAGAAIGRIEAERGDIAEQIAKIDRDLARPGLGSAVRTEMLRQRADLEQQGRAARAASTEQRASLANTPVTFDYRSGNAIRGFDAGSPLTSAVDTAIGSFQTTIAILLGAIAILGPPALLLGLLWFLWLRIGPRLPRRRRASPETPPA